MYQLFGSSVGKWTCLFVVLEGLWQGLLLVQQGGGPDKFAHIFVLSYKWAGLFPCKTTSNLDPDSFRTTSRLVHFPTEIRKRWYIFLLNYEHFWVQGFFYHDIRAWGLKLSLGLFALNFHFANSTFWVGYSFRLTSHPGPDLAMWGPRAPSVEGALKGENKTHDLWQILKWTETRGDGPSLNVLQS